MVSRLRELLQLAGKFALGQGLVGIVLNGYGAFVLIGDSHNSGWFWLFIGTAFLAAAFFSVAYSALSARDRLQTERDEAKSAASRPQIKAGVYSEASEGSIGITGPVHGEIHESD